MLYSASDGIEAKVAVIGGGMIGKEEEAKDEIGIGRIIKAVGVGRIIKAVGVGRIIKVGVDQKAKETGADRTLGVGMEAKEVGTRRVRGMGMRSQCNTCTAIRYVYVTSSS